MEIDIRLASAASGLAAVLGVVVVDYIPDSGSDSGSDSLAARGAQEIGGTLYVARLGREPCGQIALLNLVVVKFLVVAVVVVAVHHIVVGHAPADVV